MNTVVSLRHRMQEFFSPQRTLLVSFISAGLAGAVLLKLPAATTGESLSFVDALFTATSAVCVTGLTVVDTGSTFSLFGQIVILVLIQVGGLGIMSFSTALLYMFRGRFTIGGRDVLSETLGQLSGFDIRSLIKTVFLATVCIEACGAAALTFRFAAMMPVKSALTHGVFHSISAFCNAGFSLNRDSFIHFQNDPLVNGVLMMLIVLGGFGFIVIYELFSFRMSTWKRLSLHTRLVLLVSGSLILAGTILTLLLEWSISLKNLPWHTKCLASFFQSVSARTAGFNTIDIFTMSSPGLFLFVLLMFIGASPGSCGGGIKTTTLAVIVAHIRARFQNRRDTNLFSRRVSLSSISKAITITFFSGAVIVLFALLLSILELGGLAHAEASGRFIELLFEVSSAFGTVGLSTGLTPSLSAAGRLCIILVMFTGRLGPLTLALAVGRKEPVEYRYIEEDVLIG